MENTRLYQDIAKRTDGDIYVGVVGPVRTGKSTFIKKFMDLLVIPNIDNEYKKERAKDELPQSAGGKTIMTTEPKFVPNEAIEITLDNNLKFKTRLVDCVGYLVDNAIGYLEDDMPRMVKTPWSEEEIPFETAAEIGTKKVIEEHSTIGILVTTDGSITDIPREDYIKAEERVVSELKALRKPFIILLNSETPSSSYTQELGILSAEQMAEKTLPFVNELLSYGVTTLEIKSGYGLDKETELRQLLSMKILEEMTPIRIVKTYMGAHALPDEFKNNPSGYIRYICEEVLPAVKEQGIAKYCDVFCEKNVFSKEESAIIFDRAKELGLGLKIHADEIEDGGTTAFGVRYGCTSTDHLLHVSDEGIEALAFGETVATLLPITAFSLKEKYAPARRLIDKGAAVAIATDCNPGSCFSDSIPLLIALSSLNMGMTFEEIICSLTLNGAAAVGNAESFGSIQEGKYADFLVLKWEDPAFLNYHICGNGVEKVYIGGKMVRENSF